MVAVVQLVALIHNQQMMMKIRVINEKVEEDSNSNELEMMKMIKKNCMSQPKQ